MCIRDRENTVDGTFFVTARGWEELSRLLQSYEKLGIGISEELVEEFLQKEETARDFASFYQLYTCLLYTSRCV